MCGHRDEHPGFGGQLKVGELTARNPQPFAVGHGAKELKLSPVRVNGAQLGEPARVAGHKDKGADVFSHAGVGIAQPRADLPLLPPLPANPVEQPCDHCCHDLVNKVSEQPHQKLGKPLSCRTQTVALFIIS